MLCHLGWTSKCRSCFWMTWVCATLMGTWRDAYSWQVQKRHLKVFNVLGQCFVSEFSKYKLLMTLKTETLNTSSQWEIMSVCTWIKVLRNYFYINFTQLKFTSKDIFKSTWETYVHFLLLLYRENDAWCLVCLSRSECLRFLFCHHLTLKNCQFHLGRKKSIHIEECWLRITQLWSDLSAISISLEAKEATSPLSVSNFK